MRDFFRRHVLHNFSLKLISLAFAVGLWLAVAQDHTAIVPVEVPIEFRNIPENLEISSEHIPQAQIRLRGPERLVRRLQRSDIDLQIDLTGAKPGERTFDLTSQQVHHPYDLEVDLVVPSQLHLMFDTDSPDKSRFSPGWWAPSLRGYGIGRIVIDPPVINITGPSKRVEAVENAITDPVDVTGTMDARHVCHPRLRF